MVILYHNDVDGVVSAAAYIFNNRIDNYILKPVKSVDRGGIQGLVNSYDDDVVILDYAYAEGVYFWCDHHWSKVFKDSAIYSGDIVYDVAAKSAASLILSKSHALLASMVSMVDSASYPSAQYVFESEDHIIRFKRIVDRYCGNEMVMNRLVRSLVNSDLNIYKTVDFHGSDHRILMNDDIVSAKAAGGKMETIGSVSVIRDATYDMPRYSEFYFDKNIRFSIRVYEHNKKLSKISVGANPWIDNDKNIREILENCKYVKNGGGHIGVGGGMVSKRDALNATADLIRSLL